MINCRFCGSKNYAKIGYRYNKKGKIQRYLCNNCNRKFTFDNGFLHKEFRDKVITSSLDLYFNGLSLRKISNHFYSCYNIKVSYATIYNWIIEYSRKISMTVSDYILESSDTIHADEIMINIGGEWHWFWSVLCEDNRMLISSMISKTREVQYARKLFEDAKKHLPRKPWEVVTDGMQSYQTAFRKSFWRNDPACLSTKHVRLTRFIDKVNNNVMERVNGTMKDKIKIMRGFKSIEGANAIMNGFIIYYNFVRNHMTYNRTPAEVAGINLKLGRNKWEGLIGRSVIKAR